MSDKLDRELAEMNNAVGEEVKKLVDESCNRMNCEPDDIAMRMDRSGGIHMTKISALREAGIDV
jgi:hypothetical protein